MGPRLRELDPEEVGARLRHRLRADRDVADPTHPDELVDELARAVSALALYARKGLPVGPWSDRSSVADALARVLSALYSHPEGRGVAGFLTLDRDPQDALGVTLHAALGRLSLERDEPVTARELGALTGIPTVIVLRMASRGEIRADGPTGDEFDAREARRWLRAQGIPGFE